MKTVVFATCRSCDRRARLVLETDESGCVAVEFADGTVKPMPAKDAVPYLVWCAGSSIQYARRGTFVDGSTSQRVPHGPMRGKPVKARYADVPCDASCTNATGEHCRCSCGGLNHGAEAA